MRISIVLVGIIIALLAGCTQDVANDVSDEFTTEQLQTEEQQVTEIEHQKAVWACNTYIDTDLPELDYADEDKIIFHAYFGLFVYDLNSNEIVSSLNLKELGCQKVQGGCDISVKGFEYGDGFSGVSHRGSEQNDIFFNDSVRISTLTNHSGGIQGGISNGQDIYFRVAFKPVATLLMSQQTVDKEGNNVTLEVNGRHDPCVLPRAVPVVEAMAAMTILDYYLMNKTVFL